MIWARSIRSWSRWNSCGPSHRARLNGAGITVAKIRTKTPEAFALSDWLQDKEEDEFARLDAHRPFSFHEMKSDLVLPNGARFYNDHTHPEYSTPECRTLKTVGGPRPCGGAHRSAGGRSPQSSRLGGRYVHLYKNNTDFHGHSYGCHDNYLVPRAIPFPAACERAPAVSRQPASDCRRRKSRRRSAGIRLYARVPYQLSQRADFMETELSVDTMHNRPILNTRDEPHADGKKYRRLHLILGDANMCEYATALKVGTTQLVLELIARGRAPVLELEQPVSAIKQISRDADLKAYGETQGPAPSFRGGDSGMLL